MLRRGLVVMAVVGVLAGCAPEPTEVVVELPTEVPGGVRLAWERVRGADAYELVFRRVTGSPICTVSVAASKHPEFVVQGDSMPTGLPRFYQVDVEVRAWRKGEPMKATGNRPFRTP